MKLNRKAVLAGVLLIFCLIIHIYSNDENRVEMGYSTHFFAPFSRFLRAIFGRLPFSFGDILYGLLVGWLLWRSGKFFLQVSRKQSPASKKIFYRNTLYRTFVFCCSMYIVFNIFWGINYDRRGIAWQLGLEMKKYSAEDVLEINRILIEKINADKAILTAQNAKYPSNKELFGRVSDAYKTISVEHSFLRYQPASLKSSMWGWLGNYTGFTGYYNPFTGEAQLNTTVPGFLQPFIACHEVAHQLGYAKENEANFVGYLAAANSKDALFRYSVYLELFTYANRNLYFTDSTASKDARKLLSPGVVTDIKEWIEFNRRHRSFVEPVISWIYGKYLQGNKQPNGVLTYDEVTGFLIAYYKKFGRI